MSEKIEIEKDAALEPGDIIEMHYDVIGGPRWVVTRAIQLAMIEDHLRNSPAFELIRLDELGDDVIITLKIRDATGQRVEVQQAGMMTALIISATVVTIGIFTWLSLKTVYKITDSPAGKVALIGAGTAGIAVLVIVVLLLLRTGKT